MRESKADTQSHRTEQRLKPTEDKGETPLPRNRAADVILASRARILLIYFY